MLETIQQDVEKAISKSKEEVEQANKMMQGICGDACSSGDTSCSEARQTSRPQIHLETYDPWEDGTLITY